jgi:hypothetical protein
MVPAVSAWQVAQRPAPVKSCAPRPALEAGSRVGRAALAAGVQAAASTVSSAHSKRFGMGSADYNVASSYILSSVKYQTFARLLKGNDG